MNQGPEYGALIAHVVESKLLELDRIESGSKTGRRLVLAGVGESGQPLTQVEQRAALGQLFKDIGERAGLEVLFETPAVLLEQFCIMSVVKNHDTAGLVKTIRSSFMITYLNPETSDRAYQHLEGLEALRAEMIVQRSVSGMTKQ